MTGRLVEQDEDFWTDPRGKEDELLPPLGEERWCGLRIDAPAALDIARRDSLPIAGVLGSTTQEDRERPLRAAAVVVVTRLDARFTCAALLFPPKRRPSKRPAPAGKGPPVVEVQVPEGHGVEMFGAEVRERVPELPWRPGALSVRVLLGSITSAPIATTLTRGKTDLTSDPDVRAYIEAHRPVPFPRPVYPAVDTPLPTYEERADSPPLPDARGIAIAVERVNVIPDHPGARATCVVRGSFRLPLLPRDLVRPQPAEEPPLPADPFAPEPGSAAAEAAEEREARRALEDELLGYSWKDVRDPDATAVIPITLVATGVRRPGPLVVRLHVPIYAPLDPTAPPPEVTGHFAVDLLRLRDGNQLLKQTNHLWAFCGDVVAGPFTTAIVPQRAIERP